jgi:hypothetical protein
MNQLVLAFDGVPSSISFVREDTGDVRLLKASPVDGTGTACGAPPARAVTRCFISIGDALGTPAASALVIGHVAVGPFAHERRR